MPVTDPILRFKLLQKGIDPDTVNDPVPVQEDAHVDQQQPLAKPSLEKPSFLGAGAREFGRNVLPAAAGIPGSVLGAGIGTAILPGIGTGIGALIGGIGTSALAKYAQEGVMKDAMPDSIAKAYTEAEQADAESQPLAVKAGGMAANFPFFKFNPTELAGAGRAIVNPLRAVTSSEVEINALKNLAASSGTQVGISAAQQAIQNGSIDPKELLESGLMGLANKPTALAVKFGMHPAGIQTAGPNTKGLRAAQDIALEQKQGVGSSELPINSIQTDGNIDEQTALANPPQTETGAIRRIQLEEEAKQAESARLKKAEDANNKALEEAKKSAEQYKEEDALVAKHFGMEENGWNNLPDENKAILRNQFKEELAQQANNVPNQTKKPTVAGQPIPAEEQLPPIGDSNLHIISRPQRQIDLEKSRQEEKLQSLLETLPANQVSAPKASNVGMMAGLGKDISPDYTGNMEIDNALNASKPKTQAELIQDQYDNARYQEQKLRMTSEIPEKEKSGLSSIPSKQWADYFKQLGVLRNVRVNDDGTLTRNGKPVNGETFARNGLKEVIANISKGSAKLDTYPHELLHSFIDDTLIHGTESERALISNGINKVKTSPEFKTWLDSLAPESSYRVLDPTKQATEFLVEQSGKDTVRRALGTDNKGRFKNLASDIWSNVKEHFGKATNEDYARLLSGKLLKDRPFNEMAKEANVTSNNQGLSNQEGKVNNDKTLEFRPMESPYSRQVKLGFLRPELDKIENMGTPESKLAAQSLRNFHEDMSLRRGKYLNTFDTELRAATGLDNVPKSLVTQPLNYIKQNTPAMKEALNYFDDKQDGLEPKPLSKEGQRIANAIRASNEKVRLDAIASKSQLGHEATKLNPDYLANTIDRSVTDELTQRPGSAKSHKLINDQYEYLTKVKKLPPEVAKEKIKTFLDSFKTGNIDIATQFGPLDKAAGEGVARSWRSQNLLERQEHYLDRAARRLAYANTVQKTEGAQAAIDFYKSNDSMKSVLGNVTGNKYHDNKVTQSIQNLVKSTMMGVGSTARNLTTSPFFSMQHLSNPVQWAKNYTKSVIHLSDNIAGATAAGRIRRNLSSLETGSDTEGMIGALNELANPKGISAVLNRTANIMSDITGRNFSERITRGVDFGQGKAAALDFHEDMLKGRLNRAGKDFFHHFAQGVDLTKPELTNEDLSNIAGNFVDATQGTYDERGLPRQVTEGSLSPMLSLARWSFEKANNYSKYSLTPLVNGNPKPFLMSTLGMALGGTLSVAVSQLLSGRKPNTATFDELKQAKSVGNNVAPDLLYKLTGLVSAAGHTGVIGDTVKSILDKQYGKNRPQVYNNIMLEAADNVANTISSMAGEIAKNGYSHDLIVRGVSQLLEDSMQSYRLALGYLSVDKQEDLDKANKMRDLRVFNTLNGNQVVDMSSPYKTSLADLKLKEFKREQNVPKAVEELKGLIKQPIADFRKTHDADKFDASMKKIKDSDSYATIPNMTKQFQTAAKYYNFLKTTQGEEKAKRRFKDNLTRNEINRVKSSMVP